ncbi:MAG: hypothetical protein AAF432_08210 [Planctomycetota bacterium]
MSHDRDAVLTVLGSHALPCPSCRYELANVTEPRCPECGTSVRVSLRSVSGDQTPAWWLGMFGGLIMLFMAWSTMGGIIRQTISSSVLWMGGRTAPAPRGRFPVAAGQTSIGAFVLGFLMTLLAVWMLAWIFGNRKRFADMPAITQWRRGAMFLLIPFAILLTMYIIGVIA